MKLNTAAFWRGYEDAMFGILSNPYEGMYGPCKESEDWDKGWKYWFKK